jgi:hypothetical protein
MIGYPLTYKNFKDEERTTTLFFNLSMTQVANIQRDLGGDTLVQTMQKHQREGNIGEMFEFLDMLALHAYGVRSEDGEEFDNSQEVKDKFAKTAAFQAFMAEIRSSETKAANWFINILPKELRGVAREAIEAAPAAIPDKPAPGTIPNPPASTTPPPPGALPTTSD